MTRGLIQPVQKTPTRSTPGRTGARSIPADLLREASQRLSIMALLAAITWVVATVLWHLTWFPLHPGEPWPGLRFPDAIAVAAAVSSLGMYFYIRRGDRSPSFYLDLGLGYMILTCFEIGLVMHPSVPDLSGLEPMITWAGVVILLFAAIAPNTPKRTLIAGFIAAAMNPLAMVLLEAQLPRAIQALKIGMLMHYPDFILVPLAAVITQVVTRLGRQVSKAREMGSYQLGELISRGGMGEVYRATHRMLARPAAIKLIRPEMMTTGDGDSADVAVKRFHREAEAAANLRSPHTVELFDFGVTEDGTLYFVMELLEGMDLETLVRGHGPLPANRVIHILRQACESLEEAHGLGLVHRDIKPANIHIGIVGARHDFAKILDFGLVKSIAKEDSQVSLATAVGRTPGTPSYMAPEMALGEGVDARSDLYALGCVAYYLLTGKLVFDAETTFQMIAKHMRNQPVPPSLRGGVEIPRELEDVVMRCLAKNPDDRPPGARELGKALDAVRVRPWSEDDASTWWKSVQAPVAGNSPRPSAGEAVLPAPKALLEAASIDSRA